MNDVIRLRSLSEHQLLTKDSDVCDLLAFRLFVATVLRIILLEEVSLDEFGHIVVFKCYEGCDRARQILFLLFNHLIDFSFVFAHLQGITGSYSISTLVKQLDQVPVVVNDRGIGNKILLLWVHFISALRAIICIEYIVELFFSPRMPVRLHPFISLNQLSRNEFLKNVRERHFLVHVHQLELAPHFLRDLQAHGKIRHSSSLPVVLLLPRVGVIIIHVHLGSEAKCDCKSNKHDVHGDHPVVSQLLGCHAALHLEERVRIFIHQALFLVFLRECFHIVELLEIEIAFILADAVLGETLDQLFLVNYI